MIISHSRKFCYWKIARTGSNTAELCIRMANVLDLEIDVASPMHFFPKARNVWGHELESGHTTPDEAILRGYLTQDQFDDYDHYTIVRDPIERFISAYGHRMRMQMTLKMTPQDFFDCRGWSDLVLRQQSDYVSCCKNCNPQIETFPFSDFDTSIREIVSRIGGTLFDVPRLEHKTRQRWKAEARNAVEETPLGDQLRRCYARDLKLDF